MDLEREGGPTGRGDKMDFYGRRGKKDWGHSESLMATLPRPGEKTEVQGDSAVSPATRPQCHSQL